jgi:hypothetical protein
VLAAIAALSGALVVPACSSSGDHASSTTTTGPVQVGDDRSYLIRAASPQPSDGSSVVLDAVAFADSDGYAVAYADGGGAPGVQLGVSALLHHGTTQDVTIPLSPPATVPASVYVILHVEDDGNETFDYPAADQPAQLGSGVVVTQIQLAAA